MRKLVSALMIAALAIALIVALQQGWDLAQLEMYIEEHAAGGALGCVAAFAVSTVLPISALPLLPFAARIYGVWTTVLLSAAGWWLGCLAAFVIARRARTWLERLISRRRVRRIETKLPADVSFGAIVVLRLALPGDMVGFALGLLKHVRFSRYAVASLVGTIPGAVAFSFAGSELARGQYASCALLVGVMLLGTVILKRLWLDRTGVGAAVEDRS